MDEVRVTPGICRYDFDFEVPTSEFSTVQAPRTTTPYSIDNLDDVDTSTVAPTDGQVLVWSSTDNEWQPGEPSFDSVTGGTFGSG